MFWYLYIKSQVWNYVLKQGSSSFVSVRVYWLSRKCYVHRHSKQYLSFGYSFVIGKSITIILPNCIWNSNTSHHLCIDIFQRCRVWMNNSIYIRENATDIRLKIMSNLNGGHSRLSHYMISILIISNVLTHN